MLSLKNFLNINKSSAIKLKNYFLNNKDLFDKIKYSSFSTYKMEDSFLNNLKNFGNITFLINRTCR